MKTLIIIPAYNEEGNIEHTVRDLNEKSPNCELIVINDCSIDSTKDVLKSLGANYIDLPVNIGIGGGTSWILVCNGTRLRYCYSV